MSTLSVPSKTSEGTFSYAAAASGKHSPKSTTSTTPTHNTNQTHSHGTSTPNGVPADNTKVQTGEVISSSDSGNTSLQKQNTLNTTNGSIAVVNGEVSSPAGHNDLNKSSEEKISNGDKEIQSESDTGVKTIEAPKEKLIPAPPPSVNIWNQRAEEFRAKAKLQPAVVAAPTAIVSKSVPPRVSEKASEAKHVDRKRGNKQSDLGNVDTEKSKDGPGHDRKEAPKDGRKRSTDAGRMNGNPSREDGKAKPNKQSVKANIEKESSVAELPPSLGDATSWPTPETAQDEEKKERERLQAEKEKEKPVVRSSGPMKFVPVPPPFTLTIVHNAPLPTKGGRGGRGGRGGSSGRGANSAVQATPPTAPPPAAAATPGTVGVGAGASESKEKADKPEKPTGTTSSAQNVEDRGRVGARGSGLGGRGGYHGGPRGGRRTGSVGSNAHYKSEPPVNPSQDKKEIHQTVTSKAPHSDPVNAAASASGSPAQSGNVRQEVPTTAAQQSQEDGAFVGQGVVPAQYSEKPDRVPSQGYNNVNGQGYQRVDGSSAHAEGYTPARPERGSISSRGGFRSRGNHYASQHNHTAHSNTAQYHHGQSQYPSHNTSYRGFSRGSRGHPGPPRVFHQSYQPTIYSNQQFPYPYGYVDYNVNQMNTMPIVTNNGNNQIMEDALAHRDYSQAKDYYTNVLGDVTTQMEYYFSVDNLCKDLYLRQHMDSEGWVSLTLFSGFAMIKKHTTNIELLRDACQASKEIEIQLASDGYRVRKVANFKAFVMPREQRVTEVQQREFGNVIGGKTEAAQSVSSTDSGRSQMSGAAAPFQPTIPPRKSITNLQSASRNGFPDSTPTRGETNGIERTHSQLSADAAEFTMPNGFAPASPISQTEDQEESQSQATDFPDDKVSDIVIIYKKSLLDNASSPEGSPLVNGDISSNCNSDDGTETCQCSPRSGRLSRHGVGWIMEPEATHAYKHEHEKYTVIRTQALQKRLEGEPDSRRMTILYRFWSHFLVNQFNRKMYDEFKSLAIDDSTNLSLDILFSFYETMHLVSSPSEELTQDFVDLARKTGDNGSNIGTSRLETILKNPQLKPSLSNTLRSLYSSP